MMKMKDEEEEEEEEEKKQQPTSHKFQISSWFMMEVACGS
jgi:hypothetical protein